jgi:hypothetical protein
MDGDDVAGWTNWSGCRTSRDVTAQDVQRAPNDFHRRLSDEAPEAGRVPMRRRRPQENGKAMRRKGYCS